MTSDIAASQNIQLLFPSRIFHEVSVPIALLQCEWRLREAQAYDALARLRGFLEVQQFVEHLQRDRSHVVGMQARTKHVLAVVKAKIDITVDDYRSAYAALKKLVIALGKDCLKDDLQPLEDKHICYVMEDPNTKLGGDFDRLLQPWIWPFLGRAFLAPSARRDLDRNVFLGEGER